MILSHIQRDCEHFDPFHAFVNKRDFKSEVSRLSLTSKHWLSVLRPYLFRGIQLRKREDLPFLMSILRSPLSGRLAEFLLKVTIDMKEPDACQPRLSSSFWRNLREHFPAIKTLRFGGKSPRTFFPWRECISLHTFTHIQVIHIRDFRFPSCSSLLRFLGSLPSLSQIMVSQVEWPDKSDGLRLVQAPLRCPMPIPNAKTSIFMKCTDNRLAAWLFSVMCTRWMLPSRQRHHDQFEVNPVVLPPLTVMRLIDRIFDKDSVLLVTKTHDTLSEPPNAVR